MPGARVIGDVEIRDDVHAKREYQQGGPLTQMRVQRPCRIRVLLTPPPPTCSEAGQQSTVSTVGALKSQVDSIQSIVDGVRTQNDANQQHNTDSSSSQLQHETPQQASQAQVPEQKCSRGEAFSLQISTMSVPCSVEEAALPESAEPSVEDECVQGKAQSGTGLKAKSESRNTRASRVSAQLKTTSTARCSPLFRPRPHAK